MCLDRQDFKMIKTAYSKVAERIIMIKKYILKNCKYN